ncbi:FAD:protein FMN transferase [Propioniciclava soli]|uniref:FAD:protein FMN transferase n=1 Tax=Propioniciclava soli TaxID=2775081 RepID=A0ABZ3C822_9ACTN|nr:FAD:protein FMN transferase [Propioniciclava soli]
MGAPFVFAAMGTVISLHSARPVPRATQDAVLTAFATLEDRFSLWRPDTEAARFARGELALPETTEAFRQVYDEAVTWRLATGGAFTPHRPDGVVDLSGIVKAIALRDAGAVLRAEGLTDWCLNAGGDVVASGHRASGEPWVVGIVDPLDRSQLFTEFQMGPERWAVATSGTAERGEHVWRLGADDTFVQVTVCARDIVTADVLATAILAGGPEALARAQELDDIDVLACSAGERVWASAVFLAA